MSQFRHGSCQKVLCHTSHLLSPVIPWDYRRPLPLVQAFNTVIISSLLSSRASEVMMALTRKVFVCNGDYSKLQHRGSLSSLCGNGWSNTSALAGDHRARSVAAAYQGVNLGKTCGSGLGALAELSYPLCDSCQEHKGKTLETCRSGLGALAELGYPLRESYQEHKGKTLGCDWVHFGGHVAWTYGAACLFTDEQLTLFFFSMDLENSSMGFACARSFSLARIGHVKKKKLTLQRLSQLRRGRCINLTIVVLGLPAQAVL
ncbi:hypothetical protein Acr_17g0004140 [Actinidia rufa]|uniref:Uncharacterized protein n=1 Tax=Actinidia rufa TaxID=165716 RepID=A0A7J0G244_9ERIC|nr:hypothetical protein Acr_17g0004140 [Actinidia rufa]